MEILLISNTEDEGKRLDLFVSQNSQLSRNSVQILREDNQITVNGKPAGNKKAFELFQPGEGRRSLREEVCAAFDRLEARYNPVVMEGAGSISEINLRELDLVNMPMAMHAGADVILVADIDRGGVFASVYGSVMLLKPEEGVSTAEAYAGVRPAEPQVPLRDALSLSVTEWDGRVVNDFEPHIFAAHPAIASLKELLVESGAEYASMSGSGSAVYGIFSDKPELPPAAVDGLFMHIQRL